MAGRGHPRGILLRRTAARLGPADAVPRERDAARAGGDGNRHPQILLRAGELHAGPRAGGRRGARGAQLLRRRRAQLGRHHHRRRHRPRAGALDRQRPAGRRRHRHQRRPLPPLPVHPGVPPPARPRVARPGLPVPLPRPVAGNRARRQAFAFPRSTGRAGGVFPRRQRLGIAGLVRARRRRSEGRAADLGPAGLVPAVGGGAPCLPRGRDPDGHVLHGQIPRAGPRRRRLPGASFGQPGGGRGRAHHLHPVAQRGRATGSGPDGDPFQ